jgi:hypothetical protein
VDVVSHLERKRRRLWGVWRIATMMRCRLALFFIWFCSMTLTAAEAQEKRLALLVANQAYEASLGPLKNVIADVEEIGAALRRSHHPEKCL